MMRESSPLQCVSVSGSGKPLNVSTAHLLNIFFESDRFLQVASRIKGTNFSRSKSTSGHARTAVQVWTVEEGVGIGSEFRQTCCAASKV
jgi:hypothetical protein